MFNYKISHFRKFFKHNNHTNDAMTIIYNYFKKEDIVYENEKSFDDNARRDIERYIMKEPDLSNYMTVAAAYLGVRDFDSKWRQFVNSYHKNATSKQEELTLDEEEEVEPQEEEITEDEIPEKETSDEAPEEQLNKETVILKRVGKLGKHDIYETNSDRGKILVTLHEYTLEDLLGYVLHIDTTNDPFENTLTKMFDNLISCLFK